jgi:tRNA modification GTPase
VADVSQPTEPVAHPHRAAPGEDSAAVRLLVLNKSDLPAHASWRAVNAVRISCLTGTGIDQLEEAIVAQISGGNATHRDWSLAINARHKACLQKALESTDAARKTLITRDSPEFIAEELRSALDAVGDVVGRAETEEILTKIFSTFCIGK